MKIEEVFYLMIIYFLYFLLGAGIGVIASFAEQKNEQYKQVNRSAIKILFVVSLLLLIPGFYFVYAAVFQAGVLLLIITAGIFLTRRTFLYFKARN